MTPKYAKILLLVIIALILFKTFRYYRISSGNLSGEKVLDGNVKISVYYEALCPDSKFFITYQLLPVYEEFQKYITLDLVPYGKAQTSEVGGKYEFSCQHGKVECFANKIHACVINMVKDPLTQLKYVACMISDNMIPDDAGERCAKDMNVDFADILNCANDERGSKYLKSYGDRTHALSPGVKFIPTIELNENQNLVPQSRILKDLAKAVCTALDNLPENC